jgi:hypothetical protein
VTELQKVECYKCKKLLADNLVLPKGLCVYCAADEADALPQPTTQEDKQAKKEQKAQVRAEQELAKRILSRKRMLPFVEKFNPDYQAGWVHKDICQRLEQFSEDVQNKKSPRLMLFMPPRHGKSTLASIAFPAWHLGRNPGHEMVHVSEIMCTCKIYAQRSCPRLDNRGLKLSNRLGQEGRIQLRNMLTPGY